MVFVLLSALLATCLQTNHSGVVILSDRFFSVALCMKMSDEAEQICECDDWICVSDRNEPCGMMSGGSPGLWVDKGAGVY